ncbi:MFS transporter [Nocardia thailandica]|uniref:MFS transporter n=1 Tax=Nocardia thailandica TaxID=257275 RepID=UPI0005B7EE78|nr:MFS transporter [Nocardia thailandica]
MAALTSSGRHGRALAAHPQDRPTSGHRRPRAALAAICLGFFMILLDGSALNIALPSIQADTGGTMAALQWLINIYTIPLAALLLSAGLLADRVGARRLFLCALGGFTAASLACAVSPGLAALMIARCLQGLFAAGVLPTTLAIIARTYPDPAQRAKAITVWGATGGIALIAGPIGGGVLTETLGWRSIFFINVPIGVLALWLAWRHIDETARRDGESFDWLGQFLAILGLGSLVAALIEGGERGWSDPLTITALVAAPTLLIGFIATELRARAPVLPLGMFQNRAFSASITNGFAFQFGAYGLQFMIAIYLQDQWGYDPLSAGLFFVPFAMLWTFATLVLNRRWSHRGARWLLISGSIIAALGSLICLAVSDRGSWPILLLGTAIAGFGCGLFGPSCNGAALSSADPDYAGLASGVLNTARQIGMAVGIAVLGLCLVQTDAVLGARIGIAVTAVGFAAIAVLAYRYLPRQQV